jgi:hypothetical protein
MHATAIPGSLRSENGQVKLPEASPGYPVNKFTGREEITLSPVHRLWPCFAFRTFLPACPPLDETETLLGGRLSSPVISKPLLARCVP